MRVFVSDLGAALAPGRCPGCGTRAESVCTDCAARLRPAPAASPPPGVDSWAAAFAYEGVTRELVARVKYHNTRAAVPWLAAEMARVAQLGAGFSPGAWVTYVPTTRARERARGFDHGRLLARAVASELGLPFARTLRRVDGTAQTGRPVAERLRGPTFVATSVLAGVSLVVVDDVATTGASIAGAARALRAAGAVSVEALTAARTPPRAGSRRDAYTPR